MFYSMFGFQRIGDLIWAAADQRCRGFLVGATAGRTTLNGEGLQHEDGHSQLHASTVPNCLSYDAAFAYELAVIVQEGIRRMYEAGESVFYYLSVYNETYHQPALQDAAWARAASLPKLLSVRNAVFASEAPARAAAGRDGRAATSDGRGAVREGILRGLYKLRAAERPGQLPRVHLFGSGPLINQALRAQELLRDTFKVAADVWSVTSYNELYRDARAADRWNRLHPGAPPRVPFITQALGDERWPIVTTSDWVSVDRAAALPLVALRYDRPWHRRLRPQRPARRLAAVLRDRRGAHGAGDTHRTSAPWKIRRGQAGRGRARAEGRSGCAESSDGVEPCVSAASPKPSFKKVPPARRRGRPHAAGARDGCPRRHRGPSPPIPQRRPSGP